MTYLKNSASAFSSRTYNIITLCLTSYILVDFVLYHWGPPLQLANGAGAVQNRGADGIDSICESALGHLKVGPQLPAANAWKQMKWTGAPAYCPVKGQLIEALDPSNNFRRGFALKFVTDVEDKTLLLPWLYGTKVDLNKRARRVYLDLGANDFRTSVTWFSQMYPCDFTEVHAWEVTPNRFKIPSPGFNEDSNWGPENPHATRVLRTPQVLDWMTKRIKQYSTFVADVDNETSVNITRFIKEELKLTSQDTVVVKMDIEGAEWPILQRWLNDPEMAQIVDELFVEVHYHHRSMLDYGWGHFSRTREEATQLMASLRAKGFFVHPWP